MAKTAKYIVGLGVTLAAVSAVVGVVAARRYGTPAYAASAVAALINWAAGSLALVTVALCRNQPWRAQSVLLATLVRMVPVLIAVACFVRSSSPLAAAGVAGLIVVYYLVGLVVETLLSLRLVACASPLGHPSSALAGAGPASASQHLSPDD